MKTTPAIKDRIKEIYALMAVTGLPKELVEAAFEYEGVYDLMEMWVNETEESERKAIVADLEDLLQDIFRERTL